MPALREANSVSVHNDRARAKRERQADRAKEVLVEQWTNLARGVAFKTAQRAGWFRPTEDHFAAGMLGLMRAISTFDGTYEAAFTTHVVNHVRWAVLDEIRGATWYPTNGSRGSVPLPDERMISLDLLYIPQDAGDRNVGHTGGRSYSREAADSLGEEDDYQQRDELRESLVRALLSLPEDERDVIVKNDLMGMRLVDIAKEYKVSHVAIFYKRRRGFEAMRKLMEKEGW